MSNLSPLSKTQFCFRTTIHYPIRHKAHHSCLSLSGFYCLLSKFLTADKSTLEEIETIMMVSMQLKHECKDPTHHKVEPSCKAHLSAADTIRKFAKKSVCCSCLTSRLSNQADLTSLDVTSDVLTDAIADSVPRSLGFSQSDTVSKAHDQAMSDTASRSEEHTSELQSPDHLVCRLLLEKKK